MAEDIAPKLLEEIERAFSRATNRDTTLRRIANKVRDGTATQEDANAYAEKLGYYASEALREVLTEESLPDGTLYWNIAERTIKPLLLGNYAKVNEIARAILDQAAADGEGLKSVGGDLAAAESKITGILNFATKEGLNEVLGDPITGAVHGFLDNVLQENAEVSYRAGRRTMVIREYDGVGLSNGRECQWCLERAGTWDYGEAYDHGVFERHDGCGCTITVVSERGYQDARTKATWTENTAEARREAIEEKQAELLAKAERTSPKVRDREVFLREQMNQGKTARGAWEEYQKTKGR